MGKPSLGWWCYSASRKKWLLTLKHLCSAKCCQQNLRYWAVDTDSQLENALNSVEQITSWGSETKQQWIEGMKLSLWGCWDLDFLGVIGKTDNSTAYPSTSLGHASHGEKLAPGSPLHSQYPPPFLQSLWFLFFPEGRLPFQTLDWSNLLRLWDMVVSLPEILIGGKGC